jgi:hypothetical protein
MKHALMAMVAVLGLAGLVMAQDTQLKGEGAKLVADYDAKVAKLQAGLLSDLQKLLSIMKADDPQVDPIKAKIKELQTGKPPVAAVTPTAAAPAEGAPLADIKSIIGVTYKIKNGLGFDFDYTFGDGTIKTFWGSGTYKVIGPNAVEATGWMMEKRPYVFTFFADGTVKMDRTGDTMPDGKGTGAKVK